MNWLWLFLPLVVLVALGGLFLASQRPDFWLGAVKALVADMLPSLKKLFKPKPFTDEQKKTIRQGGDPFKKRRPGTGGKNG